MHASEPPEGWGSCQESVATGDTEKEPAVVPSPSYPTSVANSRSPYNSRVPIASQHVGHTRWTVSLVAATSHGLSPRDETKQQQEPPLSTTRTSDRETVAARGNVRMVHLQFGHGRANRSCSRKSRWPVVPESPKNPRAEACVRAVTVLVLWRVWRGSTSNGGGTVVAGVRRGPSAEENSRPERERATDVRPWPRWQSDTARWSEMEGDRGVEWMPGRDGGKTLVGKERRGGLDSLVTPGEAMRSLDLASGLNVIVLRPANLETLTTPLKFLVQPLSPSVSSMKPNLLCKISNLEIFIPLSDVKLWRVDEYWCKSGDRAGTCIPIDSSDNPAQGRVAVIEPLLQQRQKAVASLHGSRVTQCKQKRTRVTCSIRVYKRRNYAEKKILIILISSGRRAILATGCRVLTAEREDWNPLAWLFGGGRVGRVNDETPYGGPYQVPVGQGPGGVAGVARTVISQCVDSSTVFPLKQHGSFHRFMALNNNDECLMSGNEVVALNGMIESPELHTSDYSKDLKNSTPLPTYPTKTHDSSPFPSIVSLSRDGATNFSPVVCSRCPGTSETSEFVGGRGGAAYKRSGQHGQGGGKGGRRRAQAGDFSFSNRQATPGPTRARAGPVIILFSTPGE
ncbi:hypothetical protein WN48_03682 [Eufriesea mexicana]|nr:hypothetical protein WN48_03682 [Eufriesea mexicana]